MSVIGNNGGGWEVLGGWVIGRPGLGDLYTVIWWLDEGRAYPRKMVYLGTGWVVVSLLWQIGV